MFHRRKLAELASIGSDASRVRAHQVHRRTVHRAPMNLHIAVAQAGTDFIGFIQEAGWVLDEIVIADTTERLPDGPVGSIGLIAVPTSLKIWMQPHAGQVEYLPAGQ